MGKKKIYAVVNGRKPGIYNQWYGTDGAEAQVKGYPKARFKGFASLEEAEKYIEKPHDNYLKKRTQKKHTSGLSHDDSRRSKVPDNPDVVMYTDGGCLDNPGPGGWGVVLIQDGCRQELSGGVSLTTNNRMELTACVTGLATIKENRRINLYTDSKYVANGISKGWAKKWQANGWMRTRTEKALNADLWEQLLDLCASHRVNFIWVKGHAGNRENERCDRLAGRAAQGDNLPPDTGYEETLSTGGRTST